MMTSTSYVCIDLTFEGDPHKFWEILTAMKAEAIKNSVQFDCGRITTVTHEGA